MTDEWSDAAQILAEGGVGVLPTDTLYGLVGSALIPEAVERIYDLKSRPLDKPLIVLISHIEMLEQFGVVLSDELRTRLEEKWPSPTSIILPTIDDEFSYLHCGTGAIAFRLPDKPDLCELIDVAGPIVAPSANVEGGEPAKTVAEAKAYFGTDALFYVDEGELGGKASTVLKFDGEETKIIRK